jgi:hypothetical protein
VGAGGGALAGIPVGLIDGKPSVGTLIFALAIPTLALRLAGPLWLRAEGGILVPLRRERWGVTDVSGAFIEVYRPGIVAPLAAVVVELRSDP